MDDLIAKAAEKLATSVNAVALTGAGISTESGIPDFRSPGGLWEKVDPEEFTIDRFLQNPGRFWRLHLRLKQSGAFNMSAADPNPGHKALARLEGLGILKCLITQNVDNLHQKAGSREVVEFHGNMLRAACMRCHETEPIEQVEVRVENSEDEPPRCAHCGGLVKPDAVFFGEPIPPYALAVSQDQSRKCDVLLVVGTSLQVYPAAQIPLAVKSKASPATVIEVNRDPSALHAHVSDILMLGSASQILSDLVKAVEERLNVA
ncbi:MAG: NAD-dependent deacylase [Thermodesulfobacteriota bacterium]